MDSGSCIHIMAPVNLYDEGTLVDRVLEFFERNPEEWLTAEDIETKFGYISRREMFALNLTTKPTKKMLMMRDGMFMLRPKVTQIVLTIEAASAIFPISNCKPETESESDNSVSRIPSQAPMAPT